MMQTIKLSLVRLRILTISLLTLIVLPAISFSNENDIINHNNSMLSKLIKSQKETLPVIIQSNDLQRFSSDSGGQFKLNNSINRLINSRALKSKNLQINEANVVKQFKYSPLVAIAVTREELLTLLNDPTVTVFEDKLKKPLLSQSVSRVYSNQNISPYHGNNEWAVAVLDTGVNKNHSFLSNKVISEACYSDGGGQPGTNSLCPGGVISTTAVNSALPCTLDGCSHGTQVAGIAAGNGSTFDGVARDAKIISINVYSQVNDETFCFPSAVCIGAYTSDIIRGLERVYALRNTHKIAAANVSLGSSELFSGTCDNQPEKPIIDLLKSAKIAVTAAVGNNGNTTKMNSPACISSAIAVAATTENNDTAWSNNNTSNALDIFAPGVNITSSSSTGGFIADSGTSLASPHVAGAWAVMRHANPAMSVNAITALMKRHGPFVTQNSISRRRLDLKSMLKELSPPPPLKDINAPYLPAILQLLLE